MMKSFKCPKCGFLFGLDSDFDMEKKVYEEISVCPCGEQMKEVKYSAEEVYRMKYSSLIERQRKEAVRLVKNHLTQIEEEIAKEQNRKPEYYPLSSKMFQQHLEAAEFEVKTDEVTGKEELVLL